MIYVLTEQLIRRADARGLQAALIAALDDGAHAFQIEFNDPSPKSSPKAPSA